MTVQGSSEFVTVARAAERLAVSIRYVRDLIGSGRLSTIRVEATRGRAWGHLIRRRELDALICTRVTKHLRAS